MPASVCRRRERSHLTGTCHGVKATSRCHGNRLPGRLRLSTGACARVLSPRLGPVVDAAFSETILTAFESAVNWLMSAVSTADTRLLSASTSLTHTGFHLSHMFLPFDAHCCHMGTAIQDTVPDRVKPSFAIFDIRTLWRSALSVRVLGCQKLQMMAWPGLAQDALYSCTHMATVGVKGLMRKYLAA